MDGLIWASSMVMLDSARRSVRVPALARWLLGLGIAATLAANVAHGLGHGPVSATVAAWPAVALVGSYELSLGVPSVLHDVVLERFTERFCNTSAMCGARCRRCSERCQRWTCSICNTPSGNRRRLSVASTCTFHEDALDARFAPQENELLMMIVRGTQQPAGDVSPETVEALVRCAGRATGPSRRGVRRRRDGRPHAVDPDHTSKAPRGAATRPVGARVRPELGTYKRPRQTSLG